MVHFSPLQAYACKSRVSAHGKNGVCIEHEQSWKKRGHRAGGDDTKPVIREDFGLGKQIVGMRGGGSRFINHRDKMYAGLQNRNSYIGTVDTDCRENTERPAHTERRGTSG